MTQNRPPAGWYPDPENPGQQRYWDGNAWTEHRSASNVRAGWYPDPENPGQQRYWDGWVWTNRRAPIHYDQAMVARYEAAHWARLASLQELVGYPIDVPDSSTANYVGSGELSEYLRNVGLETGVSINGDDVERISRVLVADDDHDFSRPAYPTHLEEQHKALVHGYFLIRSVLQNDVSSVRKMIGLGVDANGRCWLDADQSYFPLVQAAILGSLEIVRLLVESGADVNQQQANGESALANAANIDSREHLEIARYLLENGANPNVIAHGRITPLAVAENSEMVRLLLDHGADPNIADYEGDLPVRARIDNGDWESVSLLVAAGTDLDRPNDHGVSARERARKLGVSL